MHDAVRAPRSAVAVAVAAAVGRRVAAANAVAVAARRRVAAISARLAAERGRGVIDHKHSTDIESLILCILLLLL